MADQQPQQAQGKSFFKALAIMLCLIPVIGVIAPRSMAVMPILMGVIAFVSYRLTFKSWPAISRTTLVAACGVLVIMALSTFWAHDSAISLDRTLKMLPIMTGAVLLISFSNHNCGDLRQYWKTYFPYACIAACSFLIADLYGGNLIYGLTHSPGKWTNGSNLSHLNRAVVVAVFFSIIGLGVLATAPKTKQIGALTAVLVVLLAAVAVKTHSQSAQLSLLVAALVIFIFPYRWSYGWVVPASIMAFFILSAPWLAQWMFSQSASWAADIAWLRQGYAADRMEIWDFISRRIAEKPWLGHGAEATRAITDFQIEGYYFKDSTVLHPHNFAIQIWIEFGVLGALLATALQACILKKAWSRLSSQNLRCAVALFCAVITIAAVGYGLWQGWWQGLWILLISYSLIAFMPARAAPPKK